MDISSQRTSVLEWIKPAIKSTKAIMECLSPEEYKDMSEIHIHALATVGVLQTTLDRLAHRREISAFPENFLAQTKKCSEDVRDFAIQLKGSSSPALNTRALDASRRRARKMDQKDLEQNTNAMVAHAERLTG